MPVSDDGHSRPLSVSHSRNRATSYPADAGQKFDSTLQHTLGHVGCPACEALRLLDARGTLDAWLSFGTALETYLQSRQLGVAGGRSRYLSDRTLWDYHQYGRALGAFFGNLRLDEIHIGHIREYQRARSERAGPQRVNHEASLLIQLLKRARLWEAMQDFYEPVKLPEFQPPRVMTAEQQDRLLGVAACRPDLEFVYCYAVLSVKTTATGCEMRGLRLGDIDLRSGMMYIRRDHVKNKFRIRPIPLVEAARWAASVLIQRAYTLGAGRPDHYLFPFRVKRNEYDPTRPMTSSGIKKAWNELRDAAGLPWLRPHDLRHQRITELAETGASDETIMAIAGHVSRSMLEHYSRVRIERKRSALEACEQPRPRGPEILPPKREPEPEEPPPGGGLGQENPQPTRALPCQRTAEHRMRRHTAPCRVRPACGAPRPCRHALSA